MFVWLLLIHFLFRGSLLLIHVKKSFFTAFRLFVFPRLDLIRIIVELATWF